MTVAIATPPRVRAMRLASTMRLATAVSLALLAVACSKTEPAAPAASTTAATPAANAPASAAPAATAANDAAQLAAMSPEQLRDAARKATSEDRMFAPAGDNAMQYYLALRSKLPGDATVSSAITDMLPFVVIGAEQSVSKENFDEAKRLYAMIQQADPHAPALPRLQAAIAAAEQAQVKRLAEQAKTAADQQVVQQKAAQLAAQQKVEADRAAATAAQQQQAAAAAAAQKAEADRIAEQQRQQQQAETARRAEQQRQQQAAAAKARATPTAADLVAISTPPPKFPPEALRSGDSGEVQVEFTVGPDGSVTGARVVGGDGRVFGRAAVEAVRRWRFQPLGTSITTRRTIGFNPGG